MSDTPVRVWDAAVIDPMVIRKPADPAHVGATVKVVVVAAVNRMLCAALLSFVAPANVFAPVTDKAPPPLTRIAAA